MKIKFNVKLFNTARTEKEIIVELEEVILGGIKIKHGELYQFVILWMLAGSGGRGM